MCGINVKNRQGVKQHHRTGSRSYVVHYAHVVSITPIPVNTNHSFSVNYMICSTNDTVFKYLQKSQIVKGNADSDPTPIEFYRITHTNKDGKMS